MYFHWLKFSALLSYKTFSANYTLPFITDAPLTIYKCISLDTSWLDDPGFESS